MTNIRTTEQTEELTALKQQATELGVRFHPNISFNKLQERVQEELAKESFTQQDTPAVEPTRTTRQHVKGRQLTDGEVKEMRRKEALELVRVRITCMNPHKSEWEGEIFTVANSQIPTQKKYVPFNIQEGWHIPRIMLNMIQNRYYQTTVKERDHRGRDIKRNVQKKEFNVEVLPPLTNEEFKALKSKQLLAAGKVD